MPTQNPRLTITLDDTTALQLRRLSELTGNSQSKLVGEILSESRPVFDRLILVLEAAKKATEEVKTSSKERLAVAQAKIEGQLGLVLEGFDEFTGSLLDEVEAVQRRTRRHAPRQAAAGTVRGAAGAAKAPAKTARAGASTPPSNRGVRSTTKTQKKPTATRT